MLTWLFVGIFRDDEFYEPNLFLKYRPTFKVNFYSPTGMQDFELNDLSPERKAEEIAFQEFVIQQHIQGNSAPIRDCLPFILIQLTVTFLSFGFFKIRRNFTYKAWQLPVHFLSCLIPTSLGVLFILVFDYLALKLILLTLMALINYFMLFLLVRSVRYAPDR